MHNLRPAKPCEPDARRRVLLALGGELLQQRLVSETQALLDRDLGAPAELALRPRDVQLTVLQLPWAEVREGGLDLLASDRRELPPEGDDVGFDARRDVERPALARGCEQRPHDIPDIHVVPRGLAVTIELGGLARVQVVGEDRPPPRLAVGTLTRPVHVPKT